MDQEGSVGRGTGMEWNPHELYALSRSDDVMAGQRFLVMALDG
jgi:hypothetical protein